MLDEVSDALVLEFAETISRFVPLLDSSNFDENTAYELLNSIFPPV